MVRRRNATSCVRLKKMEVVPVCHIRTSKFIALLPVQHSHELMQNLLQLLTSGHVRAPLGSLTAPKDALLYYEGNTSLTIQGPGGSPWVIVECNTCIVPRGTLKTMNMPEALALLRDMLHSEKNNTDK